jgi:hypothetical protein
MTDFQRPSEQILRTIVHGNEHPYAGNLDRLVLVHGGHRSALDVSDAVFHSAESKAVRMGEFRSAGVTIISARIARVIPTNSVRRSCVNRCWL